MEDVKILYKKHKGKNLEEEKEDFEEIMEAVKEKEDLEAEAQEIEYTATPKLLIVLSPGWHGQEYEALAPSQVTPKIDYMEKVNGSVIIRLG